MKTQFVKTTFNIHCKWENVPPIFRVYVNDELFSERVWVWDQPVYLNQMLQIQAAPGRYTVEIRSPNSNAVFTTADYNIEVGTGFWENNTLVIQNESQ